MDAFATAAEFISSRPLARDSATLAALLQALQSNDAFDVHSLYELDLANFDLALKVLSAWRIRRYYPGGAVLAGATLGH